MDMIYKIQRISDGLYSTGGMGPNFLKTGKTWNTAGHLKSHLAQFKYGRWDVYKGCRVVAYKVTECDDRSISIEDIFENYQEEAVIAKLNGWLYW